MKTIRIDHREQRRIGIYITLKIFEDFNSSLILSEGMSKKIVVIRILYI